MKSPAGAVLYGGDKDKDDKLPGEPWPGPEQPPGPDGGSPEGDGKHRK